jgi:NitT/TauT family transport system substrate-binding protein
MKVAKIFAKNYHVPEEVALMTIYRKTVGETRTLRWEMSKESYDEEVKQDIASGLIPSAPKFEEIVNTKLLAESGAPDFEGFIKAKVDPVFPYGMAYQAFKKKAEEIDRKNR